MAVQPSWTSVHGWKHLSTAMAEGQQTGDLIEPTAKPRDKGSTLSETQLKAVYQNLFGEDAVPPDECNNAEGVIFRVLRTLPWCSTGTEMTLKKGGQYR